MSFSGFDRTAVSLLATLPALRRPAYDESRGTQPMARCRGRAGGAKLASTIAELADRHRAHGFDVVGQQVKKVPSPWAADHLRADLLRRTDLQLRFSVTLPAQIDSAAFAPWCVDYLGDLLPVHQWLVRETYREGDAT